MKTEMGPRRAGHWVTIVAVALLVSGCTERQGVDAVGPLPVAPTAYPTGPASIGPGVSTVSEDIQAITIHVEQGAFEADVYSVQSRPMRIAVQTSGGPYTLAIDGVLQSHPLKADDTTIVGLSPPHAGEFTMRLTDDRGQDADTATLNVRAAGQR
jgi:hypothetical protein